jgi:hypothetical protein
MHSDAHPAALESAVKEQSAMDDAFEVRLHRSGRTVTIPKGETILETLIEDAVDVLFLHGRALWNLRDAGDRGTGPSRQLPRRREERQR